MKTISLKIFTMFIVILRCFYIIYVEMSRGCRVPLKTDSGFSKKLSFQIAHRNGSAFRFYIWISDFGRKNFRNLFLVSRRIWQIRKVHFSETSCITKGSRINLNKKSMWQYKRYMLSVHIYFIKINSLQAVTFLFISIHYHSLCHSVNQ